MIVCSGRYRLNEPVDKVINHHRGSIMKRNGFLVNKLGCLCNWSSLGRGRGRSLLGSGSSWLLLLVLCLGFLLLAALNLGLLGRDGGWWLGGCGGGGGGGRRRLDFSGLFCGLCGLRFRGSSGYKTQKATVSVNQVMDCLH